MALFGEDKITELQAFVTLARNDPSILHRPELAFFKDYLISLGAKLPDPPAEEPEAPESEEEPFEPESLNDEEVVAPESTPAPPLAPTGEKELTDEDYEKLAKAKEAATEAAEAGDLNKAVESYTEALLIGNPTALLYTRRADILLKQKRYAAAARDCFGLYYFRYLGNWKQAHSDIEMGQKIDYDENIWDIQKLVEQKYKIIEEHERSSQRKKEERERKERERRAREQRANAQRAYEEQKKREASTAISAVECLAECRGECQVECLGECQVECLEACPVECQEACQVGCQEACQVECREEWEAECREDWEMMAAFQDILTNPGNMAKYKDDPDVAEAISKLTRKFGGGMPGGFNVPH
ncbi:58 kDa phosphoprotein, putative [Eimeria mitis]|uniref:58 kDa phosphoprotein, putative n=1 Tax=Eimeria mitis TaxID=44415 RepID=U6KK70_9EIME|nr:58 kDa phosphoprotein, putative [Eimeria mitis]CDJ36677.1 58 kDa phosphoprotein, putative [Eimeria mitis]